MVQFDPNGLVTMHTNELEIRQLLELLSRRGGTNVLISPKVAGTITANFEGVTLEQVLKSVIKLADLVDKQDGLIHYIYTKGEMLDEAENLKKERIITKVYKLNYVRSDELWHMVRPFLSEVGSKRAAVTTQYRYGISESATFVSGGSASGGGATTGGGAGGGSAGGRDRLGRSGLDRDAAPDRRQLAGGFRSPDHPGL